MKWDREVASLDSQMGSQASLALCIQSAYLSLKWLYPRLYYSPSSGTWWYCMTTPLPRLRKSQAMGRGKFSLPPLPSQPALPRMCFCVFFTFHINFTKKQTIKNMIKISTMYLMYLNMLTEYLDNHQSSVLNSWYMEKTFISVHAKCILWKYA